MEATHEPLVDSGTFDAIQKAFQARSYNMVPQGQSADNILKGKVICGCCGGKMQRKRGTGHADWHFFTCITKNRLGADKCTGMYAREEDVLRAIYRQLKNHVNEHYGNTITTGGSIGMQHLRRNGSCFLFFERSSLLLSWMITIHILRS